MPDVSDDTAPVPDSAPREPDIIQIKDRYYILAASAMADDQHRVLKQGETFAVFDPYGDIKPIGLHEEGLYHEGTRFLSTLMLRLGAERPLLLSSTVKEDNAVFMADLTNPDIEDVNGEVVVPRGTLHIERSSVLWNGVCHERLRLRNYSAAATRTTISLDFAADFVDIFEVRGTRRQSRGEMQPAEVDAGAGRVSLAYQGLDAVARRVVIRIHPVPTLLTSQHAELEVELAPHAEAIYDISFACEIGAAPRVLGRYEAALESSQQDLAELRNGTCQIYSSNESFNNWVNRSYADVFMMVTQLPQGLYPYAGVPWFSTVFGRDGLITAMECLWINPDLARGVLGFLASTQAEEEKPEQDAEPGKILHETRGGEMAALGEIPFGRYYGSIDSTPLFVMLAAAYFERTGDRAFVDQLWPHIERALLWIDSYGDRDGDGFVEYAKRTPSGLDQQGWKDSHDSVFHADGSDATGPIALAEVQGYVYAAKTGAANLAETLGHPERAAELRRQAQALRDNFARSFWLDDLGTYALALDGRKRPCRVRASNAGQCLWTGIALPEHAGCIAQTLLRTESFSGWGIRTLAEGEPRYNPMAYHNGSVWPHDNALIAQGFSRYQLREAANMVLSAMFDVSLFTDMQRLPELFCGFPRRAGTGPTLYPVACAPQAWAAGAVFMLLQASLGLEVRGDRGQVRFTYPILPPFLQEVRLYNLKVGAGSVDLLIRSQREQGAGISILRKEGRVEVAILQ